MLTAGGAAFTYTPTGERLTRTRAGITATFRYTVLSALRGVDLGDGRNVTYQHDGAGNRAVRALNGAFQSGWLCPGLNRPVALLNASGQIAARYVHGLSENTPDYILQGGNTFRLITDHIGSVRFVIDTATGAIVQQRTYDSYGRTLTDSAPAFQPFGFAGGWTDSDTGLIRFGARDYDPEVRRWTTPDPIYFASGSLNNYAYVNGDPVNRFDPSGLNDEVKKTTAYVGKILDIAPVDDAAYRNGTSLTVTRGGETYRLETGSLVYLGDVITSSDGTQATIGFTIGGQAGHFGSTVEIVGLWDIEQLDTIPVITTAQRIWAKIDKKNSQLQIKPSGGVIGIEG